MANDIQKKLLMNFSIVTSLVFLSFGGIYLYYERFLLGGLEFSLGILQLFNIGVFNKIEKKGFACRILVGSIYSMSLIIFISGGLGKTGFLWIEFIPLFTMLMLGYGEARIWAGIYSLILLLLLLIHFLGVGLLPYSTVQIVQSVIVYLLFMFLTENNEKVKEVARQKLQEKNEELTCMSQTDGLTGLYNRAHINHLLARNYYHFKRYETPFALIMLDVDFFKKINDQFGHQEGDKVLVSISKTLLANTRKSDAVARWGGEEFLVLCSETSLEAAVNLAEKLRTSIEGLSFDREFSVTASFGVVQVSRRYNVYSLLSEADRLLYNSKRSGRNRVTGEAYHGESLL
jgi:diguanylate cyclase (GGDEF)-like protein